MDKRVLWGLFIGAVIVLALLTVAFVWMPRITAPTTEQGPRLFQLTPTPASKMTMGELFDLTSSDPVVRLESSDGNVYFRVAGAMTTDLERKGSKLVGQYAIENDPSATRVSLELGTGKKAPGIAYFPGDIGRPMDGKPATEEELLKLLIRGTSALFYINTGPSGTPSSVRDALESVIESKWSYLSGVTLSPAVVGALAASPK